MKSLAVLIASCTALLIAATIAIRSYSISLAKAQGKAQGTAQAEAFAKGLEKAFQRTPEEQAAIEATQREHLKKLDEYTNARRIAVGLEPIPEHPLPTK